MDPEFKGVRRSTRVKESNRRLKGYKWQVWSAMVENTRMKEMQQEIHTLHEILEKNSLEQKNLTMQMVEEAKDWQDLIRDFPSLNLEDRVALNGEGIITSGSQVEGELHKEDNMENSELDKKTRGEFVTPQGQVEMDPEFKGVRRSTKVRESNRRLKGYKWQVWSVLESSRGVSLSLHPLPRGKISLDSLAIVSSPHLKGAQPGETLSPVLPMTMRESTHRPELLQKEGPSNVHLFKFEAPNSLSFVLEITTGLHVSSQRTKIPMILGQPTWFYS
ncbi:hypothetical protein VNO77_14975 [Canavalia gladiata]|uniref:Uncharacterized protein n=1 Tax=Canavalia gladiata TaxID=3824 RepID=A0AAN9LZ91_CANGL